MSGNYDVFCHIHKNNAAITYAQTSGGSALRTVSASMYLSLSVGDVVDIGYCGGYQHITANYGTLFAGALL